MKGKLFQAQVAFASSFGQFVVGLLFVWPSYTSSIYSSNSTTPLSEPMSDGEISLVGSLPSLGAMFGSAICGVFIDKLGRRNGGVVVSLPYVLSWAMISVTTSIKMVLAARFLGGIAGGASLVYAPVFISEVAEPSLRGALASGPIVLYSSGALLSYCLGWCMSYHGIVWTNLAFSIALIVLIATLRESPAFLIRQNRDEEAKASLAHYRGSSPSSMAVLDEFSKLRSQLNPAVELISVLPPETEKAEVAEKEMLNSEDVDVAPEEQKQMSSLKMLFVSPASRRALLTVLTLQTFQICMGMVPVSVYAKSVFAKAEPSRADLYTIVFATVLFGGSLLSAALADKAGRRVLLVASSLAVSACMATMGYLLQSQVAPPWVTVLMIMCYCFSFVSGAWSVPYVLLAEIFVPEVQSLASMIVVEWVWFLNFSIIAVFPIMNNIIGVYGSFYVFACVAVSNALFGYFLVPETKGLSNEQIQQIYMRKKL